jgi:hypothetical protein
VGGWEEIFRVRYHPTFDSGVGGGVARVGVARGVLVFVPSKDASTFWRRETSWKKTSSASASHPKSSIAGG